MQKKYLVCSIALTWILVSAAFGQDPLQDECARTANFKIYSSAFTDKETGDLNGYEVAIDQGKDSIVNAFLYVYKGGESEGIQLRGHILGDKLTVQGNWVEKGTEYPSKKEIVQKHFIKIDGTINSSSFRGILNITGMETDQAIRLKRVKHL